MEFASGRLKILVVHGRTVGLHKDARVLGEALRDLFPTVTMHFLPVARNPPVDYRAPLRIPPETAALSPYDIVFLLERLYANPPLLDREFARRRAFVPNVEWLLPLDEHELGIRPPDLILYKNRHSMEACEKLAGVTNIPVRAVTGWTSPVMSIDLGPGAVKDYRSFLHLRGDAAQKNTSVLLDAWLAHPEFPCLTIVCAPPNEFPIPIPLKAAENVRMIFRQLSLDELRQYQFASGVHIYPSYAEGFGHALNECRQCQSVLVTTRAPPMEELVAHGKTGFLIPVHVGEAVPFRRSVRMSLTSDAVAATVQEVLATPIPRLIEMGRQAGAASVAGARLFRRKLGEALQSL